MQPQNIALKARARMAPRSRSAMIHNAATVFRAATVRERTHGRDRFLTGAALKLSVALIIAAVSAKVTFADELPPIQIVVNIGDYPSAEAAAFDEANVGWDDGDDTDDIICTEAFAAVELQRYLRRMTGDVDGERFPIIDDDVATGYPLIVIGNLRTNKAVKRYALFKTRGDPFRGLGPEGYIISQGNRPSYPEGVDPPGALALMIGGEGRVGTLYGVYRFLEELGVRWLSPGEIGEVVPEMTLKTLPNLNIREQPAFVTRGFHAWEDRGDTDFYNWMARNRMNYWCVQASDRAGLKKRGIRMNCGNHVLQYRFINPNNRYPYNHPDFTGDEELPEDPYPVSETYRGDDNADGKLTYAEAHPEWYCLRSGKRSFRIHGDGGDNFCSSNRHACDEFMGNIVQDLIDGEWKDADSINFWTLDVGKWCECESCKALGTPTDRNLLLVHRLRQEIVKAMEEGRLKRNIPIYFLAYADVIEPPTRPLPDDFDYDNCIATFFPIARCYVHTFADNRCTEINAKYREQFLGWFVDPERHYRGQVFIGEYYNVSRYKCLPIMFARTMAEDIPYYYDHGARHMHYMHCTTRHWGTKSLTNWQFSRMLWDPHVKVDDLLADYFAARYGPAADPMRALYRQLDTALSNVTILKYRLSGRLQRGDENLFHERHMKYDATQFEQDDGPDLVEMVAAIDECSAALERVRQMDLPPDVSARLSEDAGPLSYAAHTLHYYEVLVRAASLVKEGKKDEARKLLPDLKRLAEALKLDTVSTHYSSSHASAPNALDASFVAPAYDRLVAELEKDESQEGFRQ